jgi:hypothetical protein
MGYRFHLPAAIAQLAARQLGNITRTQLLALGRGDAWISRRLRDRTLIRVYPGVYAVGYRRADPLGQAMAAVLACGPTALLSHESAAALWRWRRWPPRPEVTLHGDRRPRLIRVHRGRMVEPVDRDRQHGIPVTAPERTLRDMRARLTEEQFRRAVSDAKFAKLIGSEAVIRLLGYDAAPPTRSVMQDVFQTTVVDAFDLPQPLTDTIVNGLEVDAAWPLHRVVMEIDGRGAHDHPLAFVADRDRDAIHIDHGWIPGRISWERLKRDPEVIAQRLLRLLARRTPR